MQKEPTRPTPEDLKAGNLERVAKLNPKNQFVLSELLSGRRQEVGKLVEHLTSNPSDSDNERARMLLELSKLIDSREEPGLLSLVRAITEDGAQRAALVKHLETLPRRADQSIGEDDGLKFRELMRTEERDVFLRELQSPDSSHSLSGEEIVTLLRKRGNQPGNYFDLFPEVMKKLKRRCLFDLQEIKEQARKNGIPCASKEDYRDPDPRMGPPNPRYLITPDGSKVMIMTTDRGYMAIWYEARTS